MDREAWWATVHRVSRSGTQLSRHMHAHARTHTHDCLQALLLLRSLLLSLSVVLDSETPWISVLWVSQSFTIAWSLLHWIDDAIQSIILCHPLLLSPSIFPSFRVFSNESVLCIRWPKYWSFSFNISPSNAYSGLITFRIDCFDLLAVQETHKSLLQHHSSKASILWCSAFVNGPTVTSIHDYWKTIALTIWTFVGKVISLLFNTLSRFVIAFLPRSVF